MFRIGKLKELEARVRYLENQVCPRFRFLPGEDVAEIRLGERKRVGIHDALRMIMGKYGLSVTHTPETVVIK